MSTHITEDLSDGILTITLARVDKMNSIDNAMYSAMADALARAEADPAVRVVLFQADGANFTAGNDIGDFAAIAAGHGHGDWPVTRFMKALATARRPIMAAVQGHAVGIGTTMLFHCDLVVVADDAKLVAPFVNLALVQEAASSLLVPARIGHARAYALFALGQTIDGAGALALGIANALVAPALLRSSARAMALTLAQRPAGALADVKRLMRDPAPLLAMIDAETAVFQARLNSPEAREARAAFTEHRRPDFTRASAPTDAASAPAPDAARATPAPATAPDGLLYVLDLSGGRILSVRPDGGGATTIVTDCRHPDGIVVDAVAGHLYWTNMGVPTRDDGTIERVDLDGGNRRVIIAPGATFTPKQLHLDRQHRKLYWCDREGMRVMRANLDGSAIETLVQTGAGDAERNEQERWCVGVAVDPARGHLYWTQKGPDDGNRGRIFRAGIAVPDGETPARRSDIELLYDGLPEPIDLELDLARRTIYWTDRGEPPRGNTVNSAPMDAPASGTRPPPTILARHLMEAIGIALDPDGERMFMTDLGGSVYAARRDGTARQTLLQAQGNLAGIAYARAPR